MASKKSLERLKNAHNLLVDGLVALNNVLDSFDHSLTIEERREIKKSVTQVKANTRKIKKSIEQLTITQ